MNSIRSRLLLWQITAVLLTALVVGVLTSRLAWEGFNQLRDLGLEQIAYTVVRHDETPAPAHADEQPIGSTVPSKVVRHSLRLPSAEAKEEDQFVSQIWHANGDLIYSSLPEVGPPLQKSGHHIVTWQGQSWRLYTLPQDARTVQVAVTTRIRRADFFSLTPWLLVPLMVLVLGLGLLIYHAVSRALRPLERLRTEIEQQALTGLNAIATEHLPGEIAPLARTLNSLLARVDDLLAKQRRFLADAAHELNTPLAAVKLQAQLARRAPASERESALAELEAGIERAIHLSSQLLMLARLEPETRRPPHTRVLLADLMRQAVVALAPRASELHKDLGLLDTVPVRVNGDALALRAMLDNLIDNALRYTPSGTRIDLSLGLEGEFVVLEVCDNGPGIASADRERALQRFVRLGHGDTTGSGLGLSIVRETATLHGASLALDEPAGGGLRVRIRFKLAPDQSVLAA
jgi:two-component system OmpR family sensor kinase